MASLNVLHLLVQLKQILSIKDRVSTSEMAKVWSLTQRTARTRLNILLEANYLKRNTKSKNDPNATYSLN